MKTGCGCVCVGVTVLVAMTIKLKHASSSYYLTLYRVTASPGAHTSNMNI